MAAIEKYIAYVAGKSGGHIIPCISIRNQHYIKQKALFFTTDAALDASIINNAIPDALHVPLPLNTSYTTWWKAIVKLVWRVCISFYRSLKMLRKHRPERIITTGGLIALPVCFAAYILRIPIDVYELNAIPGKTTKILRFIATSLYVCFHQAVSCFPSTVCSLVPYPLRYDPKAAYDSDAIRISYGLQSHVFTVLVLGGSQGSVSLNNCIKNALLHKKYSLQVIHQTGSTDTTDWKEWYVIQGINAYVCDYEHNLAPLLAVADYVVCRAGAGTLFEVAYFKKPCTIIPLEGLGDNHQVANAYAMRQQKKDCVVMRQRDVESNPQSLMQQIEALHGMYKIKEEMCIIPKS